MTISGPVWKDIRGETLRGVIRLWPLLLGLSLISMAIGSAVDTLASGSDSQQPGLAGYLAYLRVVLLGLIPLGIVEALSSAMVLNGMAGQSIGRSAIIRRGIQALPAVLVSSIILMAPFWVTELITYANVDGATWWLARVAGIAGSAALQTMVGFVGFEAISRGIGTGPAIQASAILTRGWRSWLVWPFLGLGVVYEGLIWATAPLNERLLQSGVTWLGASPALNVAFHLVWMLATPFLVALYLELRRLQAGDTDMLSTFD